MFPRILFVFIALTFLATARGDAPVDTFTNTLGMSFRRVPGTETLLCYWPTRVRDYRVFVKETGRKWPDPGFPQGDMHPAVCVTWEDAEAFASWLTPKEQAEGKLPASWKYRLPLETEWNIAIGLPPTSSGEESTTQVFPWGTQWPPPPGAGNYSPDLQVDPFPYTSPVASFKPNALGFFDMGGNVWQWCEDRVDAGSQERVLRGGCWAIYGRQGALSSGRFRADATFRRDAYGFRVVVER
jgi:formylglycine-generating enzyme required for sulfatase activity